MADISVIQTPDGNSYNIKDSTARTNLSNKADKADTVLDTTLSKGRKANTTVGTGSLAFGNDVTASGNCSVATGLSTKATTSYSHAEGRETTASGTYSHAEGGYCSSQAQYSHAEGNSCVASGLGTHAEGSHTQAYQQYSHSEGEYTYAAGRASHTSGRYNVMDGTTDYYPEWVSGTSYEIGDKVTFGPSQLICITANSDTVLDPSKWQEDEYLNFAEIVGMGTADNARCNARTLDWNGNEHLKGTLYVGCNADSTGGTEVATAADVSSKADKTDTVLDTTLSRGRRSNTTIGSASFAFGDDVCASGDFSYAEGSSTDATGFASHAEGYATYATMAEAHAEGYGTQANGIYSHAEGYGSQTNGPGAHAEGYSTVASNNYSHAEGRYTNALGFAAHSEGKNTTAQGDYSHTQGEHTIAYAKSSHVIGRYNSTDTYVNWPAWAANTAYVVGDKVQRVVSGTRSGYICNTANSDAEFNSDHWDEDTLMNFVEIVGNGTNTNNKSNARAVDWDGNEYLKGDLYVGCAADSTGGNKVAPPIIGEIRIWTSATAPDKWMICNGTTVSRTTYADLFSVLGSTYGGGDGSTTFAIPDFKGRSPLGAGESTATGHTAHTLGLNGGEEKHTLQVGELASHAHTFSKATATSTTKYSKSRGTGTANTPDSGGTNTTNNWVSTSLSLTLNTNGSNTAHNTLHPYVNVNFIIYTGVSAA